VPPTASFLYTNLFGEGTRDADQELLQIRETFHFLYPLPEKFLDVPKAA
jgi:hypothetical protein